MLWAEHVRPLALRTPALDEAGIGWVQIDGSVSLKHGGNVVARFRGRPPAPGACRYQRLEQGTESLQHCNLLVSLGSRFNPAREAQRLGRIRRLGSPHQRVTHMTIYIDTEHERDRTRTLQRKEDDGRAVLDGLL